MSSQNAHFAESFSIRGQEIDDIGAEKILEMLKKNNTLKTLDLNCNYFAFFFLVQT